MQPPPVNLSHATSLTVSKARQSTGSPSQSTGPPMNRIILRTLLAQYGLIIIPTSRQTPYVIYCDIVDTDMVDVDMDMEDEGRGEYFFRVLIFQG